MEIKDLVFTVVFVASIFFLLYSLGVSVTGYGAGLGTGRASEAPAPAGPSVAIYSVLFILVIIIGIVYFSKRRKYFG
jgi:hypothetical protein